MLGALAVNLQALNIDVVLVSVDTPQDAARASQFLQEQGIRLPSFRVSEPLGSFKHGLNPRWPGMLPASFLFDSAGVLRHFWAGEAFENEMVPIIDRFVAGGSVEPETHFPLAPGKVD